MLTSAGYRPQQCPSGSQLGAIHQREAYSPVVGKLGMAFVDKEYVCGQAGAIPEPAVHEYVGSVLFKTTISGEVVFNDPSRIPPEPRDYTEEDYDREMACWDN